MFIRTTPTDLDTRPTTTQQGLACAQYECQHFLIPLVAGLESHSFRRTNAEPHKYVHCYQIDINMKRFAWAELADIHLRTVQLMAMVGKRRGFFTECVQIICRPSPTGNWYICSEQVQHRARKVSSYAAI